ncbi:MAG: hypothetical protein J6L85_00335 [Clostridia bacterium]|nr:hypothetical protein [Clostridia bacterium]
MADGKYNGFLVSGIGLPPDVDHKEACDIAAAELRRAGVDPARLRFSIYKRSVDARKKSEIKLVYSVAAKFDSPRSVSLPHGKSKYRISALENEEMQIVKGSHQMSAPPLVVGMGPAGLFGALLLAENGYAPVIIDRGDPVHERAKKYDAFVRFGILDTESNIQFGAGGAGTFSDGKLLTRINDPKISYVLRRFCDFGAPEDILTAAKPHIGTDLLLEIVDRMLARIEELGGRVMYRTRMDTLRELPDGNVVVNTTRGEILCSSVIMAIGHSARDTYRMLLESGYTVEAKSFSVGVRIEHLREDIDKTLYGDMAGHPKLGKGEYHLSDTSSGRGVYTFCMCPGGEIVAAASEDGGVVVNGMSRNARNGRNSNSAVAVSVFKNDYDGTPIGAIEFQRNIERSAFSVGGGDYCAPMQTVGSFLGNSSKNEIGRIMPTYREGAVRPCSLDRILPGFICDELRRGLVSFDRKLSGFAMSDAVLTGVETRTSAPVRILRGEDMRALGKGRIYPCGEGAGYAGGITSAAIDGIRGALKIMEEFAPADRN